MERSFSDITNNAASSLEKIGQGFCGTVWAAPCVSCVDDFPQHEHTVIKRADGGPGRSLPNEFRIHQLIMQTPTPTLGCMKFRVNIPNLLGFLEHTDQLWLSILPRLPSTFSSCKALISERIPPLPLSTRKLLALKFFPNIDLETILASSSNKHCLIRPYLGRRTHHQTEPATNASRPRRLQVFSLRNFPLHVDQMTELGLDIDEYAIAMADTLAFLYWSVKIDANDVEFVLAPPRPHPHLYSQLSKTTVEVGSTDFSSTGALGLHSMWILDFDCCKDLSMDETGINQACISFWRNDPFYPRPGSGNPIDEELWRVFKERFLESSAKILVTESEEVRSLPGLLIQRITDTRGLYSKCSH